MSRLTRDGTAEPVSQDQILRRERGQGKPIFPCSVDHEQDWQPYSVDPYPCYMCYLYIVCQLGMFAAENDFALLGCTTGTFNMPTSY